MAPGNEMLQLTEARYHLALRRLAFRLALIVSISAVAQAIATAISGGGS